MFTKTEPVMDAKRHTKAQHLLLIDSDAQFRENVTQFLAEHYDTDAVSDASTAFKIAREKTPDLVLANVMAARLDGVDVVRKFRKDQQLRIVPLILYSSPAGNELCIEGLEAGANDYLITPYSERELLARIGAQLRASQMCGQSFDALRVSEERYRTRSWGFDVRQAQRSAGPLKQPDKHERSRQA